jgi:alpha-glucosidase
MKNLRTKTFLVILAGIMFAGSFFSKVLANQSEKNKNGYDEYVITTPPKDMELDPFYKKYVNVNGIHIMSSHRVPDSAFVVACRIIDFMTGALPENVLAQMVKMNTRVGIMARYEGTTDIPEHAHLANDTSLNWDVRARGLGGTLRTPLTTCAEENLLCYQIDKYHAEDILIHEFSHTIHGVGILPLDSTFNGLLQEKLDAAMAQGKYVNTYAATNIWEYWAEGVQNWFNVNAEVEKPDGKHNWVNTRDDMKKYDPDLYKIISRYFPEFESSPSCHAATNLYTE